MGLGISSSARYHLDIRSIGAQLNSVRYRPGSPVPSSSNNPTNPMPLKGAIDNALKHRRECTGPGTLDSRRQSVGVPAIVATSLARVSSRVKTLDTPYLPELQYNACFESFISRSPVQSPKNSLKVPYWLRIGNDLFVEPGHHFSYLGPTDAT
ncbi:hypothetical protein SISNIDRAFT_174983 [Sistotremastrum niveocremeum HHB9708]|uniref:Uncharacterized protein n=1 Tax=Sistotremastrum niveocremeum HHB9708 TaxID=1314777 RepID=A0A164RN73_9AGAM|nr:hypothetical protein SISNIDRAFT_174983 [Sistotremastrum niveocremeum HHB9708]